MLLGLWMGAGLWTLWVASQNASSVEDLLMRPTAAASTYLKTLGPVSIGPLANYLASEQNRSLYETWGILQIVLSAVFFFFLLFGTRLGKFPLALALLMLLIAVAERAVVTPGMNMVGRATDFATDPSHRVRLAREALNYGYIAAEATKWLLCAGLTVFLIFQRNRRSLDSRHQVDLVDKTNYRHIDG